MRRGYGPETADGVSGNGVVGRGAVYSQREGFVTPEDEGTQGCGRAVAPGTAPLGEPGCKPPMVLGAEERVERAGEDVVSRCGQETEGIGRVLGGE